MVTKKFWTDENHCIHLILHMWKHAQTACGYLRSCFMPTDFEKTIKMRAPRGFQRATCWRDEFVLVNSSVGLTILTSSSCTAPDQCLCWWKPSTRSAQRQHKFQFSFFRRLFSVLQSMKVRIIWCHPDQSCERSCCYPNLRKLQQNRNPRSAKVRAGRHENISTVQSFVEVMTAY